MTDFRAKAERFLWRAEKKYQPPFRIERDSVFCGKCFPMVVQYEKQDMRYLFGIKNSVSKENVCGEKCFFDYCEVLDGKRFAEYKELFAKLQDAYVPADNPAHDYTFISIVLCTAHVDNKLRRMIKHTNDYRQYKHGRYGWSALRLCVFDVETGAYYYNGMGKGIWECLTRDEVPQEQPKLFGLF